MHAEFLSWPMLWAWRVLPVCLQPAFALSFQDSKPPPLVIFLTAFNFASCALERCVTVSLCPRLRSLMCPRLLRLPVSFFQVVLATPTPCIHEKDSDRTELCYSAACLEAHLPPRHCFHNDLCLLTSDPLLPSDWLEQSLGLDSAIHTYMVS